MLISAPVDLTRFVENSSVVIAQGVRATAAMLTPWRLAWWTAVRTLWLSAWTTLKVAAAETSASISIPQLTCRPGSRLHSTKRVKTQRPQPWWVHLSTVTDTNTENSLFFLQKIYIGQRVEHQLLFSDAIRSRADKNTSASQSSPLKVTNQHSLYLLNTTVKQEIFLFSIVIYWCSEGSG